MKLVDHPSDESTFTCARTGQESHALKILYELFDLVPARAYALGDSLQCELELIVM
jgi:hypothetical protein